MKLIKFIDIPGHEESLQIIKVRNSSAQEIAGLLDKILKGNANDAKFKTSTTGQTSQVNISRIIAEPRTNSIIAMANSDGAKELRDLILKLDVKVVAAGSGQVHVYYLNYGDSEALSKTLSSLVSGGGPKSGGMGAGGLSRFTTGGTGAATTDTLFNSDVKINADKDNNALVVTASPTDYETVKAVIAKLDIPRDQVYVEGLMMETQVGKENGFGISIIGAYGSGGAQKAGFGKTGDLVSLMTNNITNLSGLFVGSGLGKQVDMTTPDGKTMKVNSVNGLINAIAINNNTNVLATPQILTLDNVEGVFESGEKVPVVKSTTTNGTIQNAVEQQTVALTLKITPQINKATRFIKLKIDQKIEDFSTRQLNIPAGGGMGTVIRQLNTTVVCRDKDTIAMGGLMRDKETNTVNKIPLLGDIPILGWLFKNTSRSVEKVNLLFFMTPKILASYEKTNPENVKDLLNRRQAHLKNAIGDDDSFAATAKGIYDKANRQAEGPLYDAKEVAKFQDRNNEEAASPTTEQNQADPTEPPNYQDIVKKAETKIE
jgi:general secretion pathway protein D